MAVLWTLTLLGLLAAANFTDTRTQILLARNASENAKAEALADAGFHLAMFELLRSGPAGTKEPQHVPLGDGDVAWTVEDESGKIDLNFADSELVAGLFHSVVPEPAQAALITDALLQKRASRRFHAVEEIAYLPGMTPAIYEEVAHCLTVYTWKRGIDPHVAPPLVLLALPGVDADAVRAFLRVREGAGTASGPFLVRARLQGQRGAARDPITTALAFARQEALHKRLQPMRAASGVRRVRSADPKPRQELERFLSSGSGAMFTVRSRGRTKRGGTYLRHAVAALSRGDGDPPFEVYHWARARLPDLPDPAESDGPADEARPDPEF